MRKIRMLAVIVENVGCFITRERCFQIDKYSSFSTDIDLIVANLTNGAVPFREICVFVGLEIRRAERNLDAHIFSAFSDGTAQIAQSIVAVRSGVAGDDEFAAALDQFVDAKIFEMASI